MRRQCRLRDLAAGAGVARAAAEEPPPHVAEKAFVCLLHCSVPWSNLIRQMGQRLTLIDMVSKQLTIWARTHPDRAESDRIVFSETYGSTLRSRRYRSTAYPPLPPPAQPPPSSQSRKPRVALVFFTFDPPPTTIRQETLTLMDLVSKRLQTPGKGPIDGS